MSEKILEKQILRIVEAPLVPAGNGGKAYSVIGHEKVCVSDLSWKFCS